jgi:hypothetical protein
MGRVRGSRTRSTTKLWPETACHLAHLAPLGLAMILCGADRGRVVNGSRYVDPGVPTGMEGMAPGRANTASSTLASAYGTVRADQKPRSVSGDNAPPTIRSRTPSGRASRRSRPAQRMPALRRLLTKACPTRTEATINTKKRN